MSTDRAFSVSIYCEGIYEEFAFGLSSSGTGLSSDDVLRYSRLLFAVRGAGSERFEKLTCVLISLLHSFAGD